VSRRLIAVAVAAAATGGVARAQPASDPGAPAPARPSSLAQDPATPAAAPGTPALDPGPPAAATGPPAAAPADPSSEGDHAPDDDALGDQAIAAQLGIAAGGRVTPGGLRIAGHYLYQLSDRDWFDGTASFTFGSGGAACFRDRTDVVVCNHGLADGTAVEVSASVRRMFAPQGAFRPFARVGIGIGAVRFSGDDVSGFVIPLHGGGGVRVKVAPSIAVVAEGELVLGFGGFGRGLGAEPQLGLAVTAGAEFRLR
jgi:opacity protein-like surface antigen